MSAERYTYLVEWSPEDECHIARVLEFSLLAAHGESAESALHEIKELVSMLLLDLEEESQEIPAPMTVRNYSGKINLRMPPETHKRITMEAAKEGVSINQLINSRI